jgi:hypothetical protein
MNTLAPPSSLVCYTTSGPWPDEPSAMIALDETLNDTGCFRVYREVWGWQQARPGGNAEERGKRMRIDRVLVPSPKLKNAGWCYGCVGIEGKAPGKKIGPVISQCLDYSRTVWELPESGGIWVVCPWTFIWHLNEFAGDIASIMAQQRIGGAFCNSYERLVFKHAAGSMLRVKIDGRIEINEVKCGMKAGSR